MAATWDDEADDGADNDGPLPEWRAVPAHLRGAWEEGQERAESALEYHVSEDARWELLRSCVGEYLAIQRNLLVRQAELQQIMGALTTGAWSRQAAKMWRNVLHGRLSVDEWIHEHRLALTAGVSGGTIRETKRQGRG